ncbi:hypothetical protein COEREDRAFT_37625, partial [Coemansia reversa NRRL 1564]
QKFGLNPMLILGNWSAGMVCHYAPIPGKSLQHMLIKQGFRVLHIDEFKTSMWCPYCGEGQLKKFLDVDNPRQHKQEETPAIKSHTVLHGNNVKCIKQVVDSVTGRLCPRIINHDLDACINFRHIVNGLREHGSVPESLVHPRHVGNVPAAAPDDGAATRCQQTE